MAVKTKRKQRVIVSRKMLHSLCESIDSAESLSHACAYIRSFAYRLPKYTLQLRDGKRKRVVCGWRENLLKLADGLSSGRAPFSIFAKGNSKLPFFSFSTLPQYSCPGAGACLEWCYSFKAWRYPAGFARQLQNTLLIRYRKADIKNAWGVLPADCTVRLYVDGDIDSISTLAFWFGQLTARPDINAYGYSKSWSLFLEWNNQGLAWPDNYLLNLSDGSIYDESDSMVASMLELPITRGWFRAVDVDGDYEKGFARYDNREYHREVTKTLRSEFPDSKSLSCPGKCGACMPNGVHACGSEKFVGINIGIGIHGSNLVDVK